MRISDWSSDVCSSDLAEADGIAVGVEDREQDAAPEAIGLAPGAVDEADAALLDAVVGQPEGLDEGVPALRGPPDLEGPHLVAREAPLAQVAAGASGVRGPDQALAVPGPGPGPRTPQLGPLHPARPPVPFPLSGA